MLPLPVLLLLEAWSFWMQARILSCSACVGWNRTRPVIVSRWPPAFSLAMIFGTVPSWWTALRTSPVETAETPLSFRICLAWLCGKVSCVPGRKKSWTKCVPGLPSFERSVIADWFAWISWRAASNPPPPPKPPPPKEPLSRRVRRAVPAARARRPAGRA